MRHLLCLMAVSIAAVAVIAPIEFTGPSISAMADASGIGGPHTAAPVIPTRVDVASLRPGRDTLRPTPPRLHPGGADDLERGKATAIGPDGMVQTGKIASHPLVSTPGLGFDGVDDSESFCGCHPPDGAIAVGPGHVLVAVNRAFEIWDKTGTAFPGYPKSLASLLTSPNCLATISDPFTEYDTVQDRFVLGAITYDDVFNSSVCIAVSQSGNPAGVWSVYGFPITPANDLLDFPKAAIGSDAIYLTGNQFLSDQTFLGARVYAYNKAQMYAGQPAVSVFYDVGNNAANKPADTLTPAFRVGPAGTAYFIAADNDACPCSTISLWKWTNPFGASSFTLQGGVTLTQYDQPPNAPQLGGHGVPGMIVTNDAGNLGARWYNGTVYGVHTVATNPGSGTVAGIQWYQLGNLDGAPGLLQQGVLAGDAEYRYYPNLSVDRLGDFTLGYAESSSSEFAGVRYNGRLITDPQNTLQGEAVLKAGETTVSPSDRYGDYAGEALDPDGCTVWHVEEYARAGSQWGTWVGSFAFPSCTPLQPTVLGGIDHDDPRNMSSPGIGSGRAASGEEVAGVTSLALLLLAGLRLRMREKD